MPGQVRRRVLAWGGFGEVELEAPNRWRREARGGCAPEHTDGLLGLLRILLLLAHLLLALKLVAVRPRHLRASRTHAFRQGLFACNHLCLRRQPHLPRRMQSEGRGSLHAITSASVGSLISHGACNQKAGALCMQSPLPPSATSPTAWA